MTRKHRMRDWFASGLALTPNGEDANRAFRSSLKKDIWLIEIHWGQPLTFVLSSDGDVQKFSTIEQVKYWLLKQWPVADEARLNALKQVEAAMDCVVPVGVARRAFAAAARSAGFIPETLVVHAARRAA